MRRVVVTASATSRFAPRAEAQTLAEPLRHDHRRGSGDGQGGEQRVQAPDLVVAEPGTLLGVAVHTDHVSSTSTNANPGDVVTTGVRSVSSCKNRAATASSWRTWPNRNARRNEPSVDGA